MIVTTICMILALVASPALGFASYQERLPNGNAVPHPCKVNYRWPGVGHENPKGGGARNIFGLHFKENGYQWTESLCRMDSDGDGVTNGQELGDPNCQWTPGKPPARTDDITHPGVCEPYNSPQCQGKNDFVNCELDAFENCDRIKEPQVRTLDLKFTETDVPAVETSYYCMTFELNTLMDQDYHVIADEGIVNNRDIMHHMLVYGCNDNSPANIPEPTLCGMAAAGCNALIGLWTVGMSGNCYAGDVGFRIGRNGYKKVLLQSHWNNPKLKQGQRDASGMRLYIQPARPEVQDLATFWVGQSFLQIPPGESRFPQTGLCPGACTSKRLTKSVYAIQVLNHAHYLGRSIKVEQFRNGKLIEVLSDDAIFNYDSPVTHRHDPPVELRPGDDIRITCTYNSLSSDHYVFYGEGTNEEMCFGFIMAYPADAFTSTYCASQGVLTNCDMSFKTPVSTSTGVCDWANLTNDTHPDALAMREEVTKSCNIYGFCRPECRPAVQRLRQHSCFQGEMGATFKHLLQYYPEGVKLLARMNSCPEEDVCDKQCTNSCDEPLPNGTTGTGPVAILVVAMAMFVMKF